MKLFISYAHTDKWQVQQIADLLKKGGHDPWFDNRLMPGQDWKQELENAINDCDVFLYVLSPESVESEWCQWEFGKAVELDKPVMPILIQSETPLPDAISDKQYVDFSQGITPETAAKLMGGLMQFTISISKEDIPVTQAPSAGKPAQAEAPQKHAFLSYSRRDMNMMHQMRDRLKDKNIPVWTDESIKTGASHWQTVIEKAIENAGCVLVLLSPDAKNSEWVRRELSYAKTHAIPIIPVLIRGEQSESIPFDLSGAQLVDLQTDYEKGIQEVTKSVQQYTTTSTPVDSATVSTDKQRRLSRRFNSQFWDNLMRIMNTRRCLPFIGAGADEGLFTSRKEIASIWANKHNYPFASEYARDLARVGHFVTLKIGPLLSREEIIETWLENVNPDVSASANHSYSILASFDFPIYITTNYHDTLFAALVAAGKNPQRVFWSTAEMAWKSSNGTLSDEVSSDEPMVFHLYGHQTEPESIILTEDDYLNFLLQITKNNIQFPISILDIIGKGFYLFIGFTVTGWNLRILFHILSNHDRKGRGPHLAVQIEPVRDMLSLAYEDRIREYLDKYFKDHFGSLIDVHIGDTLEFIRELKVQREKI